MCGRFVQISPKKRIAEFFNVSEFYSYSTSYNIAPTEDTTVICDISINERIALKMRWGLIPHWQSQFNTKQAPLINARVESVDTKPSFKTAFSKKRCLIFADGFYEWKNFEGKKLPYFIYLKSKQPLAFAGIWGSWSNGEHTVNSCCIITTPAGNTVAPLHDRTPGIISQENFGTWLSHKTDNALLKKLIVEIPNSALEIIPVTSKVNKATYKESDCILSINS